jgi:hypothetical protein
MNKSMSSKVEGARMRLRRQGPLQAASARGVPELRAAGLSRARASSIKSDLRPEAVVAKAMVARKQLRRG